MKTDIIQRQIDKLTEDNRKKTEAISENNRKIEELKKKKQSIEMSEFIKVISKKGMDLNTLKSKIINNEIEISDEEHRGEKLIEEHEDK